MPNLDPAGLESADPKVAMKTAQAFAASDEPAQQSVLQEVLRDQAFYLRLDDAEAMKAPAKTWRLASVLQVLRTNPAPAVHATILSLCDNATFNQDIERTGLLVRMLVGIRPSPDRAIEFWRKHGATGAMHQHMVPDALADNGSFPAVGLLEEGLRDPKRPEHNKRTWMRGPVIRHRFELPVIQMSERLVKSLPPPLAVALTEVYFTYNEKWYLSCDPPKPQELSAATFDARMHYLHLADYALQFLPLEPLLRERIEITRRALREEMKERK